MPEEEKSYSSILRSSSIIGGAQGFNLILGMLRVKFVAVLLGPIGLALLGMFQTIQGMAGTLSGLGIGSSGVRDVAEAVGSQDDERIGRTVLTLRRVCWLTGILGAFILAALAVPISHLTFQSVDYAGQIACLGIVVLMGSVAAGQMALIQGMRRIGDLARLNVISSVFGTVVAIGFYAWLGLQGIIPALVTMSAFGLVASFWFSRRVEVTKVQMSWGESLYMAKGLVGLGLVFTFTALTSGVVEYATRVLIIGEINLAAVGIFGAAFRLSGMFINFILAAMGADFYPSLTAASNDHAKMRDLVNQQTEIGLLLTLPGLLATLALAPWIIQVFYTEAFAQSAELLQWFVLGCLGRVISWPMGYIMLAKGAGRIFVLSETMAHILHLGLIWLGLKWLGIEGVSIAFCLIYVFHTLAMLFISRHLINFRWSLSVCRMLFVLLPLAVLAMIQSRYLPLIPATVIGSLMTIFVGVFCLRALCVRLGDEHSLVNRLCMIPGMRRILST